MTWTSPKTMGSELGTSSDWNTYIRDNELYLYGVAQGVTFSGTQVTRAATQSISDSTFTPISWSAEAFDYGGWWSSGTDVVVPAGAIPSGFTSIAVLVQARGKWAASGTGNRFLQVLLNGAATGSVNVSGVSGETTDQQIMDVIICEAGDIITIEGKQSSGGSLNISGCVLSVLRYAPAA